MMYAPHVSLDPAGKSPPSPCPHVVLSQDCEACGESNSGLLILEKLVSERPDHPLRWRPSFIWLVWEWKPGLCEWRESSLLHDRHQKGLLGIYILGHLLRGGGDGLFLTLPSSLGKKGESHLSLLCIHMDTLATEWKFTNFIPVLRPLEVCPLNSRTSKGSEPQLLPGSFPIYRGFSQPSSYLTLSARIGERTWVMCLEDPELELRSSDSKPRPFSVPPWVGTAMWWVTEGNARKDGSRAAYTLCFLLRPNSKLCPENTVV